MRASCTIISYYIIEIYSHENEVVYEEVLDVIQHDTIDLKVVI